jgi:hypothetical protein
MDVEAPAPEATNTTLQQATVFEMQQESEVVDPIEMTIAERELQHQKPSLTLIAVAPLLEDGASNSPTSIKVSQFPIF